MTGPGEAVVVRLPERFEAVPGRPGVAAGPRGHRHAAARLTDRPDWSHGGRGPGGRGPEWAAAVALRPRRHLAGDRARPRGAGRPWPSGQMRSGSPIPPAGGCSGSTPGSDLLPHLSWQVAASKGERLPAAAARRGQPSRAARRAGRHIGPMKGSLTIRRGSPDRLSGSVAFGAPRQRTNCQTATEVRSAADGDRFRLWSPGIFMGRGRCRLPSRTTLVLHRVDRSRSAARGGRSAQPSRRAAPIPAR